MIFPRYSPYPGGTPWHRLRLQSPWGCHLRCSRTGGRDSRESRKKKTCFFDVRISREDMGSQWKPAVDHGMQHIFPQLQVIWFSFFVSKWGRSIQHDHLNVEIGYKHSDFVLVFMFYMWKICWTILLNGCWWFYFLFLLDPVLVVWAQQRQSIWEFGWSLRAVFGWEDHRLVSWSQPK